MKQEIIDEMTAIVEKQMQAFKSDFYNYDKSRIEAGAAYPILWIVAPSHTYLSELGSFSLDNEQYRYHYAQCGHEFETYIRMMKPDERLYLITEKDGVKEIDRPAGMEAIRDYTLPVVRAWEDEHGKLPTKFKIKVSFHNIGLDRLRYLIRDCEGRQGSSLLDCLHRFRLWKQCGADHRIDIRYDSYYNEFSFAESCGDKQGVCGGIIFHGWPETGYKENCAMQLTPSYGWSLHT